MTRNDESNNKEDEEKSKDSSNTIGRRRCSKRDGNLGSIKVKISLFFGMNDPIGFYRVDGESGEHFYYL